MLSSATEAWRTPPPFASRASFPFKPSIVRMVRCRSVSSYCSPRCEDPSTARWRSPRRDFSKSSNCNDDFQYLWRTVRFYLVNIFKCIIIYVYNNSLC
jgi:hypothetical protein